MLFRQKIYIIDLDNTLYDTWPTLGCSPSAQSISRRFITESIRMLRLPVFARFRNIVGRRVHRRQVLFLSARHKVFWLVTYLRLVKDFRTPRISLILVPRAEDKVPVMKSLSRSFSQMTVIDDFSYGHERGTVMFYESVRASAYRIATCVITGKRLSQLQRS